MSTLKKSNTITKLQVLSEKFTCAVAIHYHGITASDLCVLRKKFKINGSKFIVVKNTLSLIALQTFVNESFLKFLSGPVALLYSCSIIEDMKFLVDFMKDRDKLKIVGGMWYGGRILTSDQLCTIPQLVSVDNVRIRFINILRMTGTRLAHALFEHGSCT